MECATPGSAYISLYLSVRRGQLEINKSWSRINKS